MLRSRENIGESSGRGVVILNCRCVETSGDVAQLAGPMAVLKRPALATCEIIPLLSTLRIHAPDMAANVGQRPGTEGAAQRRRVVRRCRGGRAVERMGHHPAFLSGRPVEEPPRSA